MRLYKQNAYTLTEVMMSVAIIALIASFVWKGFHMTQKGSAVTKTLFENQTNAKGALEMMSYEIRTCRDLLMSSTWTDQAVHSPFLSFQKYRGKSFSVTFSTVTFRLEQDRLYRYNHFGTELSKRMILDNLTPNTSPFFLASGDVNLTRKVDITLSLKNQPLHKADMFTTNVFIPNPPASGANIYDLP